MTMTSDTYYAIRCNAQVNNPLHPQCLTTSDGGWNDKTAALEDGLKDGWTENAGRHLCPKHSQASAATPKPERKARAKPVENDQDVYLGAPTS